MLERPDVLALGELGCIPIGANKRPLCEVERATKMQKTLSLSLINSELLAFPSESWNRVSYISQTLHKPMQLCFLKYVASQEHLRRGTQKPNSGKQAGVVLRNALRGMELGKCWEQSSVKGAKVTSMGK